jgi:ectoine hydroxylase-related dioxygenase (phytanoyl-CoA dioxygenase family)
MKFVPGSHKTKIVPHVDTYSEDNMLSRGQEISVDVDENRAVVAALDAGQASMHHGLLFHSSGPNSSGDRRIGSAIRYIKPSMKQETGVRSLVSLVSGEDHFENFKIAGAPKGRLSEEDFQLCRQDNEIKNSILY